MSSDPWRVGQRVVVRYRLPEGSHPPLTDVLGVVTSFDDDVLVVESSRGTVAVRREDVVVARAVGPAPVRRGRPHAAVSTADLERLMADGWRAVEAEWLGDWLLRASSGFTGRGNSVLPLGDPGLPVSDAVARAERWYAVRRLPPLFHLDLPTGGDVGDSELGTLLTARGYRPEARTVVMTAAASDIGPPRDAAPAVTVSATLEPEWLEAYARQRTTLAGVTEQLLTGSPGQLFLSMTEGSQASGSSGAPAISAVARLSVHPSWAGLQALWVDPGLRGRGLGRTLVRAAARLAREQRMPSMFLQVEADNEDAIALYESEGFRRHHAYLYLRGPA